MDTVFSMDELCSLNRVATDRQRPLSERVEALRKLAEPARGFPAVTRFSAQEALKELRKNHYLG